MKLYITASGFSCLQAMDSKVSDHLIIIFHYTAGKVIDTRATFFFGVVAQSIFGLPPGVIYFSSAHGLKAAANQNLVSYGFWQAVMPIAFFFYTELVFIEMGIRY